MKRISILFALALLVLPQVAFAETDLQSILITLGGIIGQATPIVAALALLSFFWGLAMYLLNFSGEEKDKKKGRDLMTTGVIVLFIMFSIWGLVNMLQRTFDISGTTNIRPPLIDNPYD